MYKRLACFRSCFSSRVRVEDLVLLQSMDRDVSFPVSHGHMRSLQRILQKARSSHVRGRVWVPDTAPQWGDAWNNMCECLDMAQCRSWHYREYGIQEVLGRCYSLLWEATFRIWDKEDTYVAVVPCHVSSFEHDRWHRCELRVGGYHRSQFNAALQDGALLLSGLQSDTRFTREAFWIEMAVSQLESTLWSMCHRSSGPSEIHFDFVVDPLQCMSWQKNSMASAVLLRSNVFERPGGSPGPEVPQEKQMQMLRQVCGVWGCWERVAWPTTQCSCFQRVRGVSWWPLTSPDGPRTGWMQFDLPASTCSLRKKRSGCWMRCSRRLNAPWAVTYCSGMRQLSLQWLEP